MQSMFWLRSRHVFFGSTDIQYVYPREFQVHLQKFNKFSNQVLSSGQLGFSELGS
jgi:hypothetical protein